MCSDRHMEAVTPALYRYSNPIHVYKPWSLYNLQPGTLDFNKMMCLSLRAPSLPALILILFVFPPG